MPRRITKSEYEALAAFRYALRQFQRFGEDAAVHIGLTPQQHSALLAIKGFPGRERISIGELAERLQVRHHSVVGLVDRLVAQELVERRHDEQDRRHVFVALTGRGAELLEQLATSHRGELRRIGPQLLDQLGELMAETGERGAERPAPQRRTGRRQAAPGGAGSAGRRASERPATPRKRKGD